VTFPQQIIAGDFIQWRIPETEDAFGNRINSPDWSVVYYLRTNTSSEGATINSSAYLSGFEFNIPAATSVNFDAGDWFYQAVASKSNQQSQTISRGSFTVLASQAYSGTPAAFDGRSQLQKDLDLIETAIRNIISGGAIQEYKIGTRNAKKYELSELLVLKSQLKVELVREKQAETIANGLGNPRATFVRFDGAY
jgi:hypothetical protein|tara:strand:- start:1241 stop:1825 length:585 start_codon:yes stop_codon:yes gene_type:complete